MAVRCSAKFIAMAATQVRCRHRRQILTASHSGPCEPGFRSQCSDLPLSSTKRAAEAGPVELSAIAVGTIALGNLLGTSRDQSFGFDAKWPGSEGASCRGMV